MKDNKYIYIKNQKGKCCLCGQELHNIVFDYKNNKEYCIDCACENSNAESIYEFLFYYVINV